jgi:hypothetical protein
MLAFFGMLSASRAAIADDDPSVHFKAGKAAFERKDYQKAAEEFEEADRVAPHGAAKYGAALAWRLASEPARAADLLALAIASGELDKAKAREASQLLPTLDERLGRIEVRAPATSKISIEHVRDASPPVRLRLTGGLHRVRAVFEDGSSAEKNIVVTVGKTSFVDIPGPKSKVPARPTASSSDGAREGSPQRLLGFVALGGAATATLAAGFFWTRANGARDAYYDSNFTDGDARDRAESNVTATNVSWIAAGTLAVAGAVLLFTSPREPAPRKLDSALVRF